MVADTTRRVSVQPDGTEFPNVDPEVSQVGAHGAISRNGRLVIFTVRADPGGSDTKIYRHDLVAARTSRLVSLTGSDPFPIGPPDVSDEGAIVAFPALVPGGARRAVVLDAANSLTDIGSAEDSNPRLSGDGRFVAADDLFVADLDTDAPDVVAGIPTTGWNTFVRTLSTGSLQNVTAGHDDLLRRQAWGGRFLSADGTRVVSQGSVAGVNAIWSHPVDWVNGARGRRPTASSCVGRVGPDSGAVTTDHRAPRRGERQ